MTQGEGGTIKKAKTKVNGATIDEIRQRYEDGEPCTKLALEYPVTASFIRSIVYPRGTYLA